MDEVLPGLWVGDLACALSTEYLSLAGVTHIVTALKSRLPPPPTLPCGRTIPASNLLHIPVDDEESEPIIVHFPFVNDFIHDILEEEWVEGPAGEPLNEARASDGKFGHWETTGSGTVLVHCQAGCSRSVALVAAYIMSTRRISAEEAVAMIRARREQSEPNEGFMDQLQLYHQAAFQVDLRHAPIRRFLMSKINVLNGDSVEDALMSYFPSPTQSPLQTPTPRNEKTMLQRNNSSSSSTSSRSSSANSTGAMTMSELSLQPRSRRPSRSSMDSRAEIVQQLALSPAMPDNTDDLFKQAAQLPCSSHPSSSLLPSHWATSISSPHEVLIARSKGNRLPGGVSGIKGHESRAGGSGSGSGSGANAGKSHTTSSSSSSSSSAHRSSSATTPASLLPKPHYAKGTMRLRCKMCRREIAARDHIVEHEPGQGIQAFDVRRRNKELRSGSKNERFAASTSGTQSQPPTEEQMFGQSRRRSVVEDDEQGQEQSKEDKKNDANSTPGQSTSTDANESSQADDSNATPPPPTATVATAPDPSTATGSRTGRPIQSAASLTASLPPHLAALRAGRAPPGAEAAQQKALEQSKMRVAHAGPTSDAQPHSTPSASSTGKSSQPASQPQSTSSMSASSRRRPILHSPECSAYFLEPLDWMYTQSQITPAPASSVQPTEAQSLSSGNLSGKLLCPNSSRGKCSAKLGNWDWAGMQCGCGAWVTPGFAVARGRVDEVWD